MIDTQRFDGGSSDRRASLQNGTIPTEVFTPSVSSGVEQSGHLLAFWIETGEVGALVSVTEKARQS